MGLVLNLPGGGEPLAAAETYLTRTLGEPVRWRFLVEMKRDTRSGPLPKRLASLLTSGPTKVSATWTGDQSTTMGPDATVIGARWLIAKGVDYLEIEAQTTAPLESPDPFVPRRRVHRVQNMKELVDRFDNIARPVKALRAELQRIKFPDKERSTIIQDGLSDWMFFFHILDQCQFLSLTMPKWLPLVLVGGVDDTKENTDGKWVLTPGTRAAYEDWGDVSARKISFNDQDGSHQFHFASLDGRAPTPKFPSGIVPVAIDCYPSRKFDAGKWKSWRTLDLPRFTLDEAMVWKIEDRLSQSNLDTLGWETKVYAVPPQAQIVGPVANYRLHPWIGSGKVDKTSSKGPWIRVKLPGFQEGEDIAEIRLTTPFSGKNGRKGLNFVPENGTEVSLVWSGRFDSSVGLLGNSRLEEALFPSPSIFLEDLYTGQYEDISVKRVGQITVDSDLSMGIKKQTKISSARPLKIHADGADLKMNDGTVFTGRGL